MQKYLDITQINMYSYIHTYEREREVYMYVFYKKTKR